MNQATFDNALHIATVDNFLIHFTPLREHIPLHQLLPDYDEEELTRVANENMIFCAKISACKCDVELSETYLGGCIYPTFESFYYPINGEYIGNMIDEVVEAAKEKIKELSK